MGAWSAKLRRLQAMTPAEVAHRLLTLLRDRFDWLRLRWGVLDESLTDFLKRQGVADGRAALNDLPERLRARSIFPWQSLAREELCAQFPERFPAQFETTLACAQQAVERRFAIFDLILAFDGDIDWFYDPLLQKSLPLDFWRNIDYYSPQVVKEVKYIWELNRHGHFVTLAKAWYLTGDDRYASALLDQWRDWLAKNPYLMGVNWSSALECAFRLISWTWALQFLKSSERLTGELYGQILQSVERHLCYIDAHLSRFSSANNHLIGEALGLIYAGYYPELARAKAWRDKGFGIFFEQFLTQIHEDGVGKEQSTWYHGYVFEFGMLAKLAAEHAEVEWPEIADRRLWSMAGFLLDISDHGVIPNIGDEDGGQAIVLCESTKGTLGRLLATAATLIGRANVSEETVFWLKPKFSTECPLDLLPPRLFRDGGYGLIDRLIGDFTFKLIIDFGPLGLGKMAAHGHADALSVWLNVNGQPVLIDSGTFLYLGAGSERNYFRSARAHNTLTVDGRELAEPLGPFQWGKRPKVWLEQTRMGETTGLTASHDGYRPIIHAREVAVNSDGIALVDTVKGIGIHTVDAYFHLAHGQVERCGDRIVCRRVGFNIEFSFAAAVPLTVQLESAVHSPWFGEKAEHPVIHLQAASSLPIVITTQIHLV